MIAWTARPARVGRLALLYVALVALTLVMLIPLIWTVSASLSPIGQIGVWPPHLIPSPIMWTNYSDLFGLIPVGRYLLNTMVIVSAAEVGALVTCSFVAYGFARTTFPGRDALFLVLLSTMMMPFVVRLIPLYVLYRQIGWLSTYLPLTVPQLLGISAFNIFLLRQFFLGIPQELCDAARIDGCGDFRIWWRIVTPLAKPALAAVAVFSFQGAWDDFLAPIVFLGGNPDMYTLTIGLYMFRSTTTSGTPTTQYLMALSVLMIIPVLVIFALGQRYFIQGVALTGLKG